MFAITDLLVRKASGGSVFELAVPELRLSRGERIGVVGPSGSGKSTLLDALAMVVRPERIGTFRLTCDDREIDVVPLLMQNRSGRLAAIRARCIGYVLQTGGLLPYLSVRRNIELSRRLLGLDDDGTVEDVAERLGIARHFGKLPAALSVGERQRVAIARALAHRPAAIVADEPTASLDPHNARIAMDSFMDLTERYGTTAIIATHDRERVHAAGLRVIAPRLSSGSGQVRAVFAG